MTAATQDTRGPGRAASAGTGATPMMEQYLALKAEAPRALLFFRMGDFYELFLDDAAIAARVLDIALTHRGEHEGRPLPMCGVPVHSHEAYLARLVKAGHAVAIAEQLEDPAAARKRGSKAVVRRGITRVLTAGTLTEERLLDAARPNWLAAGFPPAPGVDGPGARGADGPAGLAFADISTGAFHLADLPDLAALERLLARLAPAELLWPEDCARSGTTPVTPSPLGRFDSSRGERLLKARFGVATLDGFGSFARPSLAAAAALLAHLDDTQCGVAVRLDPPRAERDEATLQMDAATRASLELTEGEATLLAAIDRTVTPAGRRLLSAELAAPLTGRAAIEDRLDLVQWFASGPASLADGCRQTLSRTPDLARALGRLSAGRGSPRDLAGVRDGIAAAGALAAALADAAGGGAPASLRQLCDTLAAATPPEGLCPLLAGLVDNPPIQAGDGGAIRPGFDEALDAQRLLAHDTRAAIAAMEGDLRARSGIPGLKVRHNAVIGYHVEVASRLGDALMADPAFTHRQTLAGTMRFDTADLRSLAARIAMAEGEALAAEARHLDAMRADVLAAADIISALAGALAALDRSAALAVLTREGGWVRPQLSDGRDFHIVAGRHPVVEAARRREGQPFVPNDCRLEGNSRLWLLTGPNMGGKSTVLRQNALIAILAQAGSFVPAVSARLGIVDRLFSRVGASDRLAEGRSTFMVEMVETAAILSGATDRSLLLLDEVGRGTATWDGLALAWAILEDIHDRIGARCLFASHYHELTTLADRLPSLALRTMAVRDWQGGLVFLHEVVDGAARGSFGLAVARLAGVPAAVLARAADVLHRLEGGALGDRAREALSDLPLFRAATVTATAPAPEARDLLRERLASLHPDSLTPRAALDLLYDLKALAEEEPGATGR